MHCSTIMVVVPSRRESGKILNKIMLEVLMNCTKYFDLSSSLKGNCVKRFMIC